MLVNDARREKVDPGLINGGGIKWGALFGPLADLAMHLASRRWDEGVRVVGDYSSDYETARDEYTDVTREAVDSFNEEVAGADWSEDEEGPRPIRYLGLHLVPPAPTDDE